jgi:NADP-dependent 3-hydroxy acid dehydrogenase YdfG
LGGRWLDWERDQHDLKGEHLFVTGGAAGIGEAIAYRRSQRGAKEFHLLISM